MSAPRTVRKAVIPAAGLGTRFLPATKAIPKEMLPIVDVPTIQYVVEEVVQSGLTDVVFVTGRGKSAIIDHFDVSPEIERFLEEKGKPDLLKMVREVSRMAHVVSVRQKDPLGLGHAVLVARRYVGNEPLAVLPEKTHLYGVIAGKPIAKGLYHVDTLVEKPAPGTAPTNLSVLGRYVLPPEIFDILERTAPGRGGEIQLTDALQTLAQRMSLYGLETEGRLYDAGDRVGFIEATVAFALKRPELAAELRPVLRRLLDGE